MNLLQISYFLLAAETLSFKDAAEKLYVSQPAVSIQIASLEKEWGFRLFYRKYRSVALTPAGENMYKMLKQAEQNYTRALSISRNLPDTPQKIIHMGIPEWFDTLNLNEVLKQYMQTHPDILIRIEAVSKDMDIFPVTDTHPYDILITFDDIVKDRSDLVHVPFSSHNYALFVSKKHPLCSEGHVPSLSELSGWTINLVVETFEDNYSIRYYEKMLQNAGISNVSFKGYSNAFSAIFEAKIHDGILMVENSAYARKELPDFSVIETNLPCCWVLAWRKDTNRDYVTDLGLTISSQIQKTGQKMSADNQIKLQDA